MTRTTTAAGVLAGLAALAVACSSKDGASNTHGSAASSGASVAGTGGSISAGRGGSGATNTTGGSAGTATDAGGTSGTPTGGSGNADQGGTTGGVSGAAGAPTPSGGRGNGTAGTSGGTMPLGGRNNSAGSGGANAGSGSDPGGATGDAGASGCSPSDEFEGDALDACWLTLNGTAAMPLIQIAETGGALRLSAHGSQNGVWYGGATKSLVYQLVSQPRFTLTTAAHPRKVTAPDSLPTKDLHVGGLMVRNPSSSGGNTENYVFLMVGHSENNNGVVHQGVEFKTTVNGCSDWAEPDWGNGADEPDAELRICRLGAEFRMYKRVPGAGTWTVAEPPSGCAGNNVSAGVLSRTDLPDTVQVGLALNFNAPSDLDVSFDFIRFRELPPSATADDCTSD